MQDMIPRQGRSIRNIPMREGGRAPIQPEKIEVPRQKGGGRRRLLVLIGAGVILVCAALGVLLSTLFERTTITLRPHTQTITMKDSLVVMPKASGVSLSYDTLSVVRSATTSVNVTGTKHVSRAASGVITVYNTTNADQKLITNTRFASPDGKIYRIKGAITVPKSTKTTNGSITLGTITTTVYADQPGASYNLENTTKFTIPGYKNDPRYASVYGQSQAAITGGFVGEEPSISSSDLASGQKSLKQGLDSMLSTLVRDSVPEGFVMVPGSINISYTDIAKSVSGTSTASLSESATSKVVIVRLSDLAASVAKQVVSGYRGEAVLFADPATLVIALASSTPVGTVVGPIRIVITGPVTLVWQFDENAIKQALLGKPKSSFETIIRAFQPGVEGAEAKVRPFWESSFPGSADKITMLVEVD